MIVNNGKICFGSGSVLKSGIPQGAVKWSDGTANASSFTQTNMYLDEARGTGTQRGVHALLGVGTTPVTEEDYCLAETEVDGVDINTKVTCTAASVSGADGDVVYTFTFYNESSTETYTVTELCITDLPYGSSLVDKYLMLARTVLATPRTIEPHETVVFAYRIKY